MTTTVMFSGKEGKNSSKVLAPPGGRSSNIFGGCEEPAPAPAQKKAQTQSQSPFAVDTPPKQQDTGPAKPFKPVSSFNPITNEPHSYAQQSQPQQQQRQSAPPPQQQAPPTRQAPPPQQQQVQQASALPQQGSPITGENKTSVKIYNPPGGRSSITF